MDNGHKGLPCEQTDWQTHMTENITFPQLNNKSSGGLWIGNLVKNID